MKNKGVFGLLSAVLLNSLFIYTGFSQGIVSSGQKPNLMILFTDDPQYDAIRALDGRQVKTANTDKPRFMRWVILNVIKVASFSDGVIVHYPAMPAFGHTVCGFIAPTV